MTFKTAFTSMTLMLLLIPGAYASPADYECRVDVFHMNSQIEKYSSITTTNGYQITEIFEPITANNDSCMAYGSSPTVKFKLSWKVHKWGTTLKLLI
ncbi:hypothetical protein [Candidatus Sororendozoicomonas aggregata]|uniref:hypothetical protein n=1 Tax=Candidatus Sororendozoicomonas aggregata TaxID=3073239 RepID=UPI002ED41A84